MILNGLSVGHFATRSLQLEQLRRYLKERQLMKFTVEENWSRNEDLILVQLTIDLGWGEFDQICLHPYWALIANQSKQDLFK